MTLTKRSYQVVLILMVMMMITHLRNQDLWLLLESTENNSLLSGILKIYQLRLGGYPIDYLCQLSSIRPEIAVDKYVVTNFLIRIQLGQVRMSECPSKRLHVCLSVRPSICNIYELILAYCQSTKNLRNYAFACLFKGLNP